MSESKKGRLKPKFWFQTAFVCFVCLLSRLCFLIFFQYIVD